MECFLGPHDGTVAHEARALTEGRVHVGAVAMEIHHGRRPPPSGGGGVGSGHIILKTKEGGKGV